MARISSREMTWHMTDFSFHFPRPPSPPPHQQMLPLDIRQTLLLHEHRSSLLEVVLDLGRCPEARFSGSIPNQCLRKDAVTENDLRFAESKIGSFGGDNRAGITGTLHRIRCGAFQPSPRSAYLIAHTRTRRDYYLCPLPRLFTYTRYERLTLSGCTVSAPFATGAARWSG